MGRRIDVEPDDILQLGGELGSLESLKVPHPVRLQAVRRQMRCTDATADAGRLRHRRGRSSASSRPAARSSVSVDHPLGHRPAPSGGVAAAGASCRAAARRRPPAMKRSCQRQTPVFDLPVCAHDLRRAAARRRSAARSGPARHASAARCGPRRSPPAGGDPRRDVDGDPGAHAPDSHTPRPRESPAGLFRPGQSTRVDRRRRVETAPD